MSEIGEVNEEIPRQEDNGSQENRNNETEDLVNRITSALESLGDPLTLECCIYKVPKKIRQLNEVAYSPSVISIGPFHNGEKGLESMENLKLRYLKQFCENRVHDGLLGDYLRYLKQHERRIRHSYAEPIKPNESDEFVKIILIDSCFIFEYFIRRRLLTWSEEDRVLLKDWLENNIITDLILLENHVPFFVLKDLYHMAFKRRLNDEAFPSLSFFELTKYYFNCFGFHTNKITNIEQVKHFTDLVRVLYLPPPTDQKLLSRLETQEKQGIMVDHLPSASQLYEAGFKFSAKQDKGLVHLQFENGVLEMSRFELYDETEIIVRNVMAFEQCHYTWKSSYVAQFMYLLDFLITTSSNVDVLVQRGIIMNALGDSIEVATMVNNLSKNIILSGINPYYRQVCDDVNKVYKKGRWQKWKAILLRQHFGTPWKAAASVAALLIVVLTLIQTICSCQVQK